jgi:hypothetical protein
MAPRAKRCQAPAKRAPKSKPTAHSARARTGRTRSSRLCFQYASAAAGKTTLDAFRGRPQPRFDIIKVISSVGCRG